MKRFYPVFIGAAVFSVTALCFLAAATDSHLSLDDWGYTAGCPFVKTGFSFRNAAAAFLTPAHGGIWMPVTYISYMLDFTLFGGGWKVHHLVNVTIHALTAAAVFFFLRRLLSAVTDEGKENRIALPACLAATFLWALHPMRAEAVVWIASRKEELWTLFAVAASIAWIGFLEKGGRRRYWATFALFALSCFSKPTAVAFPVLALILQKLVCPEMKIRLKRLLPFFAFSAAIGIMAIYSQANPSGAERIDLSDTDPAWRLLNAFVSLGLYLFNTFIPVSIHMDYRSVFGGMPLRAATGTATVAAAAALIAAYAFFGKDRAMKRCVLAAGVWYLTALLPVLGILGFTGDKAFADRYSYLPSILLSFVAAAAVAQIRPRRPRLFAVTGCAACAVALAVAARPVIASFANDLSAYSRVLAFDPGHWRALRMVGRIYAAQEGRTDEGIAMLKRSLSLRPSRTTLESLVYLLAHRGKGDDFAEVRRLGAAVVRNPALDASGMILDALGVVSMREGDDAKAVEYFCASLRAPARSYTNVHTILNLGLSLANAGKRFEAVETLAKLHAAGDNPAKKRAREAIDALRKGSRARFAWRP